MRCSTPRIGFFEELPQDGASDEARTADEKDNLRNPASRAGRSPPWSSECRSSSLHPSEPVLTVTRQPATVDPPWRKATNRVCRPGPAASRSEVEIRHGESNSTYL